MSAAGAVSTDAGHVALRQAAAWFATLHGGQASAAEREQWQRWIDADPAHRAAWERVEAVNRRFGMLPAEPARSALSLPHGRRAAAKKLLVAAAAAALGGVAARREGRAWMAALGAGERTGVGELRQLALADGSALWMNTDSALDIDFSSGLRRLALYRGEILLRTAADAARPARPLALDLADGRLSASGARFGVRQQAVGASVAVFEGSVRLDLRSGGAGHVIGAGQRVRFGPGWAGAPTRADELLTAWTRRRLSVEDMRLSDFVADLSRYWRGHIGCHPALAGLTLTGSYPLGDIERILAAVERTLPLRVERILPWWITLEPIARGAIR